MFYPQTKSDSVILMNFKAIKDKYRVKLESGHIIKKPNGIYPRLLDSKNRGKRSAEEVIKSLCQGLINDPPFSIIYDIMKDMEIKYDDDYDVYKCDQLLSFINLSNETPAFNKSTRLDFVKKYISESNFNPYQLSDISKYVCRLSIKDPWV